MSVHSQAQQISNFYSFAILVAGFIGLLVGIRILLLTESRLWALVLIVPSLILRLMIAYIKLVLSNKIYLDAKRKLSSEYWMQFSDDGSRFPYADIDSTIQWSFYCPWLRDDQFFVLYQEGGGCSVIPRRAFSSAEDDRLTRLLTSTL